MHLEFLTKLEQSYLAGVFNIRMKQIGTTLLVGFMSLLWIIGYLFTPKDEQSGMLGLSVSDASLAHIRPWVYLTAGFYHPYTIQLIIMLLPTMYLGKRVETYLGTTNLIRLVLFVNVLSSLYLFMQMFVFYIIFRETIYLSICFCGFSGGLTALLVAYIKQSPYSTLSISPSLKLRFYPLCATAFFWGLTLYSIFLGSMFSRIAFMGAGPYSTGGLYLGWYYLRFFCRHENNYFPGDISDDFRLVVLFPDVCKPMLEPVCNFSYNVAKLLGYFKKRSGLGSKQRSVESILPVVDDQNSSDPISERRKARAKKALDMKLAKLATANMTDSNRFGGSTHS